MGNVLDTVRLPKMSEIVADRLRQQIIAGELVEGDPLPPEDQLMEHAGVARTTVREALRILESEGLLVVRRGAGGGARIRTPQVANVARYIGLVLQSQGTRLEDVHSARVMLEAPAAGLLATMPDRARIVAALRDALEAEAAAMDDPVALSHAHGRFHQLIVRLAGSETFEVLTAVANRIIQVQADRVMGARDTDGLTKAGAEAAHRAHARYVDMVEAGASQDAEDLWRKHLEAGEAILMSDPSSKTVLDLLE
ncbi:FadR/GntR family transcriptional regulator [[Mycobacterium] wendilense]|uniref:GntR family transcriptional regulator n=1 Tax=[Mycobacterium] wendilense TaxID=3064284 RepID=A0ABN9P7J1_9MYCO|nr:GntR family transcriptional regulator [Mycolicibacterium sp. MU0050]CAJ1586018.1 GntR family transcriptional regulator [Mycolicibacterium sp. MU0050]